MVKVLASLNLVLYALVFLWITYQARKELKLRVLIPVTISICSIVLALLLQE